MSEFNESKERKSMIMKGSCMLCTGVIFLGVTFGLLNKYDTWPELCSEDMTNWLKGFGYMQAAYCLIGLLFLVFGVGKIAIQKTQGILGLVLLCVLVPFNFAWLCYGNKIVYDDAYRCRDIDYEGIDKIWKMMLAYIILGYPLMLCLLCGMFMVVCVLLASCGVIKGDRANKLQNSPIGNILPKRG